MIEKFNFYDVYGYFVPGAAFLAIFWIPFGLVRHKWPSSTWTDAIVAAVLAYIVGHLLQSIATNAIPSWEVETANGKNRYPSEIYLDHDDNELPEKSKKQIETFIKKQFNLELNVDQNGDDTIDEVRHNAFLLARQVLIQGKAVSYAEQSQGMYALTRGLVSVFALAFAYWLGWAAAVVVKSHIAVISGIVVLAASVVVLANISFTLLRPSAAPPKERRRKKRRIELVYAAVLLVAFYTIGYAQGVHFAVTAGQGGLLAFLSAWAFIACLRAYGAYKSFAGQFAATVWRDYLAYNVAGTTTETQAAETARR
ncbi:MAG: hypothetical protein WCF22_05255 [Candidatus Sulfotelmatobacter sp.]